MMSNMYLTTNSTGIALIKHSENLALEAYLCPSGIPTIGWGHTHKVRLGDTCTREQAEEWLALDVQFVEGTVRCKVDVPLNENQFSALVSFVFNVGVANFIKSTLLRLLNEGLYDQVPAQLRRWVYGQDKQGNKIKLPGLVIRREEEIKLWNKATA